MPCARSTRINTLPSARWSDAAVIVDDNGKPVFSVVKANGEYKMNLDFSLVCKKRRTLDAVLQEMINRGIIDVYTLGQVDIAMVNDIIRRFGFETACRLCFVDARRFRVANVADVFCELWNELAEMDNAGLRGVIAQEKKNSVRKKAARYLLANPDERIVLSRGNFMTARGFDAMKREHPDYEAVQCQEGHRRSEGGFGRRAVSE